ncbi:hypothetical protein BJP36_40330 [Moorena producens JHB]|uniref:Uncharacterized protein n=1 Tax=Moorena producens (strain JHB) TaxID=1454205 RepID=A0A9Q9SS34_MOOP1|nr:hypothetical protein [Moorena producens]WAN68622.1 hypothetical protein BJP36_40330 [Moorena producens JHB]
MGLATSHPLSETEGVGFPLYINAIALVGHKSVLPGGGLPPNSFGVA